MFHDELTELLNIKKQCIWIKGYQEKEIVVKTINALIEYDIDRIFTWCADSKGINEIIVDEENSYSKTSLKESRIPIDIFFEHHLQTKNDTYKYEDNYAMILSDYDLVLENSQQLRMIRSIAEVNQKKYIPLIFISEKYDPPAKLDHLFSVIEYTNPTLQEIETLIDGYESARKVEINNKEVISKKLLGFNKSEIIELLDLSFYRYNCVDLSILNTKKIELINNTNIIDYQEPKAK